MANFLLSLGFNIGKELTQVFPLEVQEFDFFSTLLNVDLTTLNGTSLVRIDASL